MRAPPFPNTAVIFEKKDPAMTALATQTDPNGIDPHASGAKLDSGKAPVFKGFVSYFPRAMTRVAEVSAFGSRKYVWGGWKSVKDGFLRYTDGLCRHLAAEGRGEMNDPESEIEHAAHTAWNAMARLELLLMAKEDGREQAVAIPA